MDPVQADCDSINASLKAIFSKLYQLEGNCSLPASISSVDGSLEMQQQVAAAVADQHAAVLQRLCEVDITGVDTHVVQRRLLQAAMACIGSCNTAHLDIVSQGPCPEAPSPSSLPHLDPDTPRAATSKPRRTASSTSRSSKTLSSPLQQSRGSFHKSSMPPPPDRAPSVPGVLSRKVRAPSSSKPISTGTPSTPAGTPGQRSTRPSQLPGGVSSTSFHPVPAAETPSMPSASKSIALPSLNPKACTTPPPPHPAAALAGLPMEMEEPILEDESCLLDPSDVFHPELLVEASGAAERQHKPDLMSGRHAPPHGLRGAVHEAQPKQQQPHCTGILPHSVQQQQQFYIGLLPHAVQQQQQQQLHATHVRTAAQGFGAASLHMNKANGVAIDNHSTAAAGVESPTALQQSQVGTHVTTTPLASAAPLFFSGISEQTCNDLLAEVAAAEKLALKEGRPLLSVDGQLYLGGRPTSHPLQWAKLRWDAAEQSLKREDSVYYSDVLASPPVVVSTGLAGPTQQQPLHVAPQQGQRPVTQTGGPGAESCGQPCSVAGCGARQQPSSGVQGAQRDSSGAGCGARQQSSNAVQGGQPGSQAVNCGAQGSAPQKKGSKKRSRSSEECAENGASAGDWVGSVTGDVASVT